MKREHIALPALKLAAAAALFFASTALAEPYCVDKNHRVIEPAVCDDPTAATAAGFSNNDHFFKIDGPAGASLGGVVHSTAAAVDTRSVAARHNDHGNGDLDGGGFGLIESTDPAKLK
ncbi:hypothetical protein P885DRAFT_58184 [Corynascus similis CBS 632.67]